MKKIRNQKYYKTVIVVEDDNPVISGLSLEPSEMWAMMQQGKPISAYMLSDDLFDDGLPSSELNVSDGVPIHRQRGVDVASIWQNDRTIRRKLRDGYQLYKQTANSE